MRVFLDNNVPAGVARILSHHGVSTSPQMGWTRVQNGMLLAEAESAGFAVMVTADQNIKYQQDLAKRTIRACSSRLEHLAYCQRIRRKDCGSSGRSEARWFRVH
jgi:hypothetical protein